MFKPKVKFNQNNVCSDSKFTMNRLVVKNLGQMVTLMKRTVAGEITVTAENVWSKAEKRFNVKFGQKFDCSVSNLIINL